MLEIHNADVNSKNRINRHIGVKMDKDKQN